MGLEVWDLGFGGGDLLIIGLGLGIWGLGDLELRDLEFGPCALSVPSPAFRLQGAAAKELTFSYYNLGTAPPPQ